jgi:MFS family permease
MKTNLSQSESQAHPVYPYPFMASTGRALNQHKTLHIIALCMALQTTGFVVILPLFALRFSHFGAGAGSLGTSVMTSAMAGALAAPLLGTLADRFGRRPLVVSALAIYVLSFGGFLIASSPQALILLRAVASALSVSMIPAVLGIVGDIAPADRRAQWIGFISGGASAGWIVGPILGGFLYDHWGYNTAVFSSLLMAFAAFLIALLALPETRKNQDQSQKLTEHPKVNPGRQSIRAAFPSSLSVLSSMLVIYFLVMLAWTFIEPRFMFYAYEGLGWTSSMLGFVMSTYGIALMLGEFGLGRLSDRLGRRPVIVCGVILFSAQFIGLAFFQNYLWISVSFVIAGLGNALFDPALSASILDITPREHQARIQGIRYTTGSVGAILGSALAILATALPNPQTIFFLAAGVSLLAASVGLFVNLRRKEN